MLPVVMRGAATFAGETMDANERGVSVREAAKGALKPALQAAVQAVAEGFQGGVGKQEATLSNVEPQSSNVERKSTKRKSSSGSKKSKSSSGSKKRKSSSESKKRKSKSKSGEVKQEGKGKMKASSKRAYKGKRKRSGNQFGGASSINRTGKAAGRKRKSGQFTSLSKANTNF